MSYPANYSLNQQIRRVLYALKRQYGGYVVVYQNHSVTTDTKTGRVTRQKTATPIRRAIVLPVKIDRELKQSISLISANKQLVMGGSYEAGKRTFIIERRDCPRLVLTASDWLVYNDHKFNIENFEEYEFDSAYVILGKELKGESTHEPIVVEAGDDLTVAETPIEETEN
ncbi:MAG: hypothetical protein ABFC88_12860 [Thermoguttaceae bacterium]